MCRFHSADAGRACTIYINGKEFKAIQITAHKSGSFYNIEYYIPENLLKEENGEVADSITVKFHANKGTLCPGLYYLRLLKEYHTTPRYSFSCYHWKSADANRVNSVEYDRIANTVKVLGKSGNNNIALQMNPLYDDSMYIKKEHKYLLVKGTTLKTGTGMSYLWWLNGCNKNSQVAATYEGTNDKGETFIIWDTSISGLNDYMQSDSIGISTQGKAMSTVFGITSSASDYSAVISDIGFYSMSEMLTKYPEVGNFCKVNVFSEDDITFNCTKSYQNVFIKKQFKADEWTAICFPFNMTKNVSVGFFSDVKKYCGTTLSDEGTLTIYFEDFTRVLKDSLLLVKSIMDMETMEISSVKVYSTTEPEAKISGNVKVQGTYTQKESDGNTYSFNNQEFQSNTAQDKINSLCFYIQLTDDDMENVKDVVISFDKMPSNIHQIKAEVKSGSIYTIDGVKIGDTKENKSLNGLPKGIYIIGGKKIAN